MDGLLLQGVPGFQVLECLIDLLEEARLHLQPVVTGTENGHRQGGHPMHRCSKGVRIGGGIETIQLSLIGQVAGIQGSTLRLPETQMAGGVAGSVEAEYLPAAQLEAIPIFQKPSGSVLIDLVCI